MKVFEIFKKTGIGVVSTQQGMVFIFGSLVKFCWDLGRLVRLLHLMFKIWTMMVWNAIRMWVRIGWWWVVNLK